MALRHLDSLPTLADVQRTRRASPKPPATVIRQQRRKDDLKAQEDAFKNAVWDRDQGKSRASGKPLWRNHLDPDKRGHVAHLIKRSAAPHPADKFNPDHAILLSATEHALSDARTAPRGLRLLEIVGTIATGPIVFVRRDETGKELWRRTTRPPGR